MSYEDTGPLNVGDEVLMKMRKNRSETRVRLRVVGTWAQFGKQKVEAEDFKHDVFEFQWPEAEDAPRRVTVLRRATRPAKLTGGT
jgi:hypothetical protein